MSDKTVRVVHTSDWEFNSTFSSRGNSAFWKREQWTRMFSNAEKLIQSFAYKKIDVLIHAGDVVKGHTPNSSRQSEEIIHGGWRSIYKELKELSKTTKIFLTIGSHDYDALRNKNQYPFKGFYDSCSTEGSDSPWHVFDNPYGRSVLLSKLGVRLTGFGMLDGYLDKRNGDKYETGIGERSIEIGEEGNYFEIAISPTNWKQRNLWYDTPFNYVALGGSEGYWKGEASWTDDKENRYLIEAQDNMVRCRQGRPFICQSFVPGREWEYTVNTITYGEIYLNQNGNSAKFQDFLANSNPDSWVFDESAITIEW
jgi:hypothetical protein